MRFYELPLIRGSTEEQIAQIKDFLFLQAEVMNFNLENGSSEKVLERAQQALTNAANQQETQAVRDNYSALRDLIVGTADIAIRQGDSFSTLMRQVYAAKGALGTFREEITREVRETAQGVEEAYSYAGTVESALNSYTANLENFIKTGYLDTAATPPVFGVEIGLLAGSYTQDGQTVANETPHKIRITPDRISFFSNQTEAAYLSEGAIHFPNAEITGGTINIGNGTFQVSNQGAMTATSGSIGGVLIGEWNSGNLQNNKLYLGSTGLFKFDTDSRGSREGMFFLRAPDENDDTGDTSYDRNMFMEFVKYLTPGTQTGNVEVTAIGPKGLRLHYTSPGGTGSGIYIKAKENKIELSGITIEGGFFPRSGDTAQPRDPKISTGAGTIECKALTATNVTATTVNGVKTQRGRAKLDFHSTDVSVTTSIGFSAAFASEPTVVFSVESADDTARRIDARILSFQKSGSDYTGFLVFAQLDTAFDNNQDFYIHWQATGA